MKVKVRRAFSAMINGDLVKPKANTVIDVPEGTPGLRAWIDAGLVSPSLVAPEAATADPAEVADAPAAKRTRRKRKST